MARLAPSSARRPDGLARARGRKPGRKGETREVAGAGQEATAQAGEPTPGAVVVALPAVGIAARMIGELEMVAVVAGEERAAEGGCVEPLAAGTRLW